MLEYKDAIAVIDGDSIAYKAGYLESPADVQQCVNSRLSQILQDTMSVSYFLYIEAWEEDKNIFRHKLFDLSNEFVKHKGYKGNRLPDREKPPFLNLARELLRDTWNAEVVKGYEAEDYAIAKAKEIRESGRFPIVCAIDKDLMCQPYDFYNYDKRCFTRVDRDQATLNLWRQVLTGDSTDNIPGIKGIGPAKAKKIIPDDCEDPQLSAAVFFKYKGLSEGYFIEQFNLIYIRKVIEDGVLVPPVCEKWTGLEHKYDLIPESLFK
jgi:hypothetical protein